jgi:hypothetical protein
LLHNGDPRPETCSAGSGHQPSSAGPDDDEMVTVCRLGRLPVHRMDACKQFLLNKLATGLLKFVHDYFFQASLL